MKRGALFTLWLLVAWCVPPVIAGGLGWKGVWGSGSAFVDYILPLPIAGGFLHVPSLAVTSLILFTQPWTGRPGGYVRGLLLAGAMAGVLTLLDLDRLHLALTTDGAGGGYWQQQPVGLFVLSDFALAQLFVGAAGGRWPDGVVQWAGSLLVAVVLPGFYAAGALKADPRQNSPFVHAGARNGPQRGDESVFIFSKLPTNSPDFRRAAAAILREHDPRGSLNAEDMAIHFFDSLAAAQSRHAPAAKATVCLYQDGTPTVWSPGYADCFRDHESFSECLHATYAVQDPRLPIDVQGYLARRDACAGRTLPAGPPGVPPDNSEIRACDPRRVEQARQELLKKFEGHASAVAALQ